MLRLRPLRLLPLRLQPLAWGGVRRGAWRAQSGVRRGAQRAQSDVRCGAQVQLPVQVRLPAQLSNFTGSAKSLIEPARQPPSEVKRRRYTLGVKDRDDPLTEMIAKKIIKIAQTGVHDAAQLSALAITQLSIR